MQRDTPFRYPKTSNAPLRITPVEETVDWTRYGSYERAAPINLRHYFAQELRATGPQMLQKPMGPAWFGQPEYESVLARAADLGANVLKAGQSAPPAVMHASVAQKGDLDEMVQWTWGPTGGAPLLDDFIKPRAEWTSEWGPDVMALAVEMYLDYCASCDPDPGVGIAVSTPLAFSAAIDAAEDASSDFEDDDDDVNMIDPSRAFSSEEEQAVIAKEERRIAAHEREFTNPSDTNPGWPTFKSGPNRRLRRIISIVAGAVLAGRMTVDAAYGLLNEVAETPRAAAKFSRLQNKPAAAFEYFERAGDLRGMQPAQEVEGFYCRQRGIYIGDLMTALLAGPGAAEIKWALRENPTHSADPKVIAQTLNGSGELVDGDFKKFDLHVRSEHNDAFRLGTTRWLERRMGAAYARIWDRIVALASHLDILEPRVRTVDGAFRHRRIHGLNSGVKWTSLQGTIQNAVAQLMTYAKRMYVRLGARAALERALLDLRTRSWAMSIWGDDALLRIPVALRDTWSETIQSFGLKLELSPRTSFLKVDYERRGDVVFAYGGVASHYMNKFNKETRLIARAPGALVLSMAASVETLSQSPFFQLWREAMYGSTRLAVEALAAAERLGKGGVERLVSEMLRGYATMSVMDKKATRGALNAVLMLKSAADGRIQQLAGPAAADGYTDMRTWVREGATVSQRTLAELLNELSSFMR